jgi:hypothetical protein
LKKDFCVLLLLSVVPVASAPAQDASRLASAITAQDLVNSVHNPRTSSKSQFNPRPDSNSVGITTPATFQPPAVSAVFSEFALGSDRTS